MALPKLLRNRARCTACSDIIESKSVHDHVTCSCGAIFVDGGTEYLRRGGNMNALEDWSEWEYPPDYKPEPRKGTH